MLRRILQLVIRLLFRLLSNVDVEGLEQVPISGGCVIASNHLDYLDAPALFMLVERQDFTGMVAMNYQRSLFIRILVRILKATWIDRENPGPSQLRDALAHIKRGGIMGVAPEGTRSSTAKLNEGKPGVAYLATKAGVPIIPIAIWGTETAVKQVVRLRRPTISIRIGAPFTLPPLNRKNREGQLKQNADELMCRIAAMLPPSYRGYYADHPRLADFN